MFIFLTTYSFDFSKNIKNLPLSIKNIEIYGVKNSDKNKIQKKLEQFKGISIFLIDRKGFKEAIKDFEFVKALNNVDFPIFGRPIIPHLKPIYFIFD